MEKIKNAFKPGGDESDRTQGVGDEGETQQGNLRTSNALDEGEQYTGSTQKTLDEGELTRLESGGKRVTAEGDTKGAKTDDITDEGEQYSGNTQKIGAGT